MTIGPYILIIVVNVDGLKCTNQKTHTGWVDADMCMFAFPLTTSLCLAPQMVCDYFMLLG